MRVWREKILCVDDFTTNYKNKKRVLKIRFLEHGGVVNTRRSVLLYIYIYIYIYISHSSHTKEGGDNYTHRFVLIFFI